MLTRCDFHCDNGAVFRIELSACQRYWFCEVVTPAGRKRYRVYNEIGEAIGAGLTWTRHQRAPTPSEDETDD